MAGGSIGVTILTGAAGQAAGSLVGPAVEAGRSTFHCLKQECDYIKNLDQNFQNLEMEARYLSSREKDVRQLIDNNPARVESTHECATWLEHVERTTEEVKKLETRYHRAKSGCYGPCLLTTNLKLSKKIVKMTNRVINLRDRMNIDHAVRLARHPDRWRWRSPNNIVEVPSQCDHVEKLVELLKDETIKKIGIWGICGAGKTTILERLIDELENVRIDNVRIFDIVLWVEISKENNLHEIQEQILEQLRVRIELQSEAEVLISKSLENKNYLLLLDGVSSYIDLHRIGFRDSHNFKVVLATRERGICDLMETDEEIKVERLSDDDARKLFRSVVGEVIDHGHINLIADKVLKQCGGIPHFIKGLGAHLKDNHKEHSWRLMLLNLQSPNLFKLKHLEDVFNPFKVIFEELDDILKDCLFYAVSFPEDHEIDRDYLVECWMAHELVSFCDTFRNARDAGHTNLDNFIGKCLFDSCGDSKAVKVPIMFRNTSLRMAEQRNLELLENPQVGSWTRTNANVISLMDGVASVEELPDRPNCHVLSFLFVRNQSLSKIPESFFNCMAELRILDLCGTSIRNLPPSISNLITLKGLYVNDCSNLVHLPDEIERLENLEFLDIRRIGIHFGFLVVIGRLTCLKSLRVSFTSDVTNRNFLGANRTEATPSIIQQLFQLEELTVDADPLEPNWNMISPAMTTEVARLGKLSTLSFYFSSTETFETFAQTSVSWKSSRSPGSNFRSFNIYIGSQNFSSTEWNVSECTAPRCLYYSGGRGTPNFIKEVLRFTTAFELLAHQNIINFSDFGIAEMECLELCRVEDCNAMTIFLSSQIPAPRTPAFRWLRKLHLLKLGQLKLICQGPITSGSFAKLSTLSIEDCPNLIEVASWEMAKHLSELQKLRVKNCPRVKEIVAGANQSAEGNAFLKLKTLELIELESLVSIHSDDTFIWRELQSIDIDHCDKLANLCLSTTNATKLRRIRCSETWWQAEIDNGVRRNLQSFCCFS